MEKGLRILLLTDGLSPWVTGGMQQHSAMLAKHLGALCDELVVAHCGAANGPVPSEREVRAALGLRGSLIGVPFVDRGRLPGHYVRASKAYSRALRAAVGDPARFDVVYAQGFTGWAFRDHPRLVVNLHGLEMFQPAFSRRESWAKSLLRPTAQTLLHSAHTAISLGGRLTDLLHGAGLPASAIAEIPNGIPGAWLTPRPTPRMPGPLRALLIGRNEPRKGYDLLQTALSALPTPIALDVVGPWPSFPPGIHDVTFHGTVTDRERVRAILDASDVLVVPSRAEGMPTVILEALARGRHVIATDVGATATLLASAPGCRLIPPSAPALTAALADFAAAPPQPQRFDLSRYTWSRVASDHIRLFQRLR